MRDSLQSQGSIERELGREVEQYVHASPREVAWTYLFYSACHRSSLAGGYFWPYCSTIHTPKTTRTRWQITNLSILRTLPEVDIRLTLEGARAQRYGRLTANSLLVFHELVRERPKLVGLSYESRLV